MLETAVFGAYCNVMINLKDITDEKFKLVVSKSHAVVRMRRDGGGDEALGTPHAWAPPPFAT